MKIINTFSREELLGAFLRVLPPERAAEEADILSAPVDEVDENGIPWFQSDYVGDPRVYSSAFLDLLSLVSEATAAKAWALLNISTSEGQVRRARFQDSLNRGEWPKCCG